MVLRDWYIQHENKKRQKEVDDRDLAPYQEYLNEAIERAWAQEREILGRREERRRRPRISLAEALVKLPIKSLGSLEDRFWDVQREKRRADQYRREFLHWLRTTKPHLGLHDPQEQVQRFSEIYKTPFLKAYEEAYQQGLAQGLAEARRDRAAAHGQPDGHNGKNGS